MLTRIVYASLACPDTGQAEIDAVVEKAQVFNREHGITGVLAFDGSQIVQIIEGPEEAVEALYGRIREDNRHEGVVTLTHDGIAEPHFPNWAMVRRPISDVLLLVEDLRSTSL
jgi:hypothetical protein